jgi:hypothetical protein
MGIGQNHRMIGGISVKEVRSELDWIAHRPPDPLAKPATGRAAARVEAGQFDPRVGAHSQRLQFTREPPIRKRIVANDEPPRPLEGRGHAIPAMRLAEASDSPLRLPFNHVAQEVMPMTAAGRQQGRVG